MQRLQPGVQRAFIYDNLKAHLSDDVILAIYNAGHIVIPRPAYYPCDGPIEYVNHQIEMGLKSRLYFIRNHTDLVYHLHQVIANIRNIDATFVHCGYL